MVCIKTDEEYSKRLLRCSKKITSLIMFFWIICVSAGIVYICEAIWYLCTGDIEQNAEKTLLWNTFYPYGKTKSIYYLMSLAFEIVRTFTSIHIVVGNDFFFIIMLFYVTELYYILSNKFDIIFDVANKNIHQNCAEGSSGWKNEHLKSLRKELHKLQKEYIQEHIALNK